MSLAITVCIVYPFAAMASSDAQTFEELWGSFRVESKTDAAF
jgi:hypothetical protein